MDGPLGLDALVAPLRDDVLSGASGVAAAACGVMGVAARKVPAATPEELRDGLTRVAHAVLDAQPAMAPLVALVSRVLDALDALDGQDDVERARVEAEEAARAFAAALERDVGRVAEAAAALLPSSGTVLTLSASATVLEVLRRSATPALQVVVLESRPGLEGRRMATDLSLAGLSVTLAVDAAGATLAAGSDAVLLGADSVGDAGVVNKLGSLAVAHAAVRAAVPVLVAAARTKILPPGFPQPLADDRPAHEVWDAANGVRVWNRYFEAIPLDAVTAVVTESSAMTPAEVEAYRLAIRVPDGVRAWARQRR